MIFYALSNIYIFFFINITVRLEEEHQSNSDVCSSISEAEMLEKPRKRSTKIKRAKMQIKEERFESQSDDEESEAGGNPGWADVMQKILQTKKPKRKRTIVLSKAKKLCDIKKKNDEEHLPFEIAEVKKEVKTKESEEVETDDQKPRLKEKRKGTSLSIRVKPSIMDRERERTLQKIATK